MKYDRASRVLLTGATGYIGRRLLPCLAREGYRVVCLVRDRHRLALPADLADVTDVIEGDLLDPDSLPELRGDFAGAYYLVHSLGQHGDHLASQEEATAGNFGNWIRSTGRVGRVVYLGGIANAPSLSPHLSSRRRVEDVLRASCGEVPVTVLRAAIIVGSGSASFEIIRDLVEKLPVLVAPKWLRTRCQPVAIRNVVDYLLAVIEAPAAEGQTFDIGGPDILTYQEMLLGYAEVRGLKRWVIPVPVLTPTLSSYWLYFVTSTSYPLARNLVESMKVEVICRDRRIREVAPEVEPIAYREAVRLAFQKIEQNLVISSWHDALVSGSMHPRFGERIEVPAHGVLRDVRRVAFTRPPEEVQRNFWRIGGGNGWYTWEWAWRIRGWLDRLVGGTGLRRGRRDPERLRPGDALDFWRVLVADERARRLLLYAEMKLPGDAWLEWEIEESAEGPGRHALRQTATFRPNGLWGRVYWYGISPLHGFVFRGMAREIAGRRPADGSAMRDPQDQ